MPYDGNDPAYRDFYHDNYEHFTRPDGKDACIWLTKNERFHEYWLNVMKEIIDNYQPDLLYSDSWLPFEEEKVCSVELLGRGALSFAQHSGVLVVDLPDRRDEEYPNVLKIRFEK